MAGLVVNMPAMKCQGSIMTGQCPKNYRHVDSGECVTAYRVDRNTDIDTPTQRFQVAANDWVVILDSGLSITMKHGPMQQVYQEIRSDES